MSVSPATSQPSLQRVVGLPGAVLLGLGSILGTGVFVSLGISAGVAGTAMLPAILVAGGVALLNGLSSAQLAAAYPVSGGTYEYGYRLIGPRAGFAAGWMFLCAKSASAATGALGLAGYLLNALGVGAEYRTGLALGLVLATTFLVAGGMQRSARANTWIVGTTLLGLLAFVAGAFWHVVQVGGPPLDSVWPPGLPVPRFLEACALLFVAFTGYGRIATLGEEVHEPRRTIPRAILTTLAVSVGLYVAVAGAAIALVGAGVFAKVTDRSAAPLEVLARSTQVPGLGLIVGLAAMTAMGGVLLNLLLGLSRVLLAMARRGDMPGRFAQVHGGSGSPRAAVWGVGALIAGLVCVGDLRATWSFSAFTVLVYYALTNWSAIRLPRETRRYPRAFAWLGLVACLGLAFWVPVRFWIAGTGLLALGWAGQQWARTLRTKK